MIDMKLDGKPFKARDFDKLAGDAINQQVHDYVVPKTVNFLMGKIEKFKRDKNFKHNSLSLKTSGLTELALMDSGIRSGQLQKKKIVQSITRELMKKGMKVTTNLDGIEIHW